jgi:uncharacterized protein with ATP-grasp and redox domains
MKTTYDCIPCFVRQAFEAVEMSAASDERQRRILMRELLHEIAETDWSVVPVAVAQRIQRTVRKITGSADPYRNLKDQMNQTALRLLPSLREAINQQENRLDAIVRVAVAGNLLDAGSKHRLEHHELEQHLKHIWGNPFLGSPDTLFAKAQEAEHILYLCDNAGEIVFDKLLIEALPKGKITVAVRGAAVINDATMDDAITAGIPDIAPVITNGSDAPGTRLEECSDIFRKHFEQADVIISKGQGNYETLSDRPENIFFLLSVKCPVIGNHIGAEVGTMICKQNQSLLKSHAAIRRT